MQTTLAPPRAAAAAVRWSLRWGATVGTHRLGGLVVRVVRVARAGRAAAGEMLRRANEALGAAAVADECVFVAVVGATAAGVVAVETPVGGVGWMEVGTGARGAGCTAVAGVSRIYVEPAFRRRGIARHMLRAVCQRAVYGVVLAPREVAFSPPSSAGAVLARDFHGVCRDGRWWVVVYRD